jgi:choline dehydrogenase-like flavoprotein
VPICPIGAQYAAIVHVNKAEKVGVRILANSRVDQIETGPTGRITQVRFGRPDGSSDIAKGRLFVLAANAVESPRLLLASASESLPRGLANSSDQVGRNFMEHPANHVGFETPFPLYAGRGPVAIASSGAYRDGAFRTGESAANIGINNPSRFIGLATSVLRRGLMPPELDKELRHLAVREGSFLAFVEQLADPDNRITIDWDNRDSAGQPRIQLHYSIGAYERRGLARARDRLKRFLERLEATHIEWSDTFTVNHLMGTLRMGADPKLSVADPVGRAHDHPNLFIAGSALFPSCGTVGPTLTIAALTLRMADAMARQLS